MWRERLWKKGFLEIKLPTSNWNCGFSPRGIGEVTPPESSNFPPPTFNFFSLPPSHSLNWWGEFWCDQNASWFESNKKKVQKGDMVLRTKGDWLNVKSSVTAELGVCIVDFVMVTVPEDKRSSASLLAREPIRHGSPVSMEAIILDFTWVVPCCAAYHMIACCRVFQVFMTREKLVIMKWKIYLLISFIHLFWGRRSSIIGQAQR